jgi:hypothetical protein
MLTDKRKSDKISAELYLYDWACGRISTAEAKAHCVAHGFQIDFRQADVGAYLDATDVVSGEYVRFEI